MKKKILISTIDEKNERVLFFLSLTAKHGNHFRKRKRKRTESFLDSLHELCRV